MTNHHHHDTESNLPFEEKLNKLFAHWIKHNDDHIKTYEKWSKEAEKNGFKEIATLIRDVSDMTGEINEKLKSGTSLLQ